MHPVIGVVIPAAVFVAVVVVLFMVKPEVSSRILLCSIVVCAVLGLILYGVGYAALENSPIVAMLKSIYSLCRIFIGESDYADIASVPGYTTTSVVCAMYLVHTVGLFSTIGAALSAFGAAWLRKMRLRFSHGGKLCLLLGANEKTLSFARNLLQEDASAMLIFVDENPQAESGEAIEAMGALLYTDAEALSFSAKFLRALHASARTSVTLYALSDNFAYNMKCAKQLCTSMQKLSIPMEKTALSAIGSDDDTFHPLLGTKAHYGYGSIIMRSEADMVARLLTLTYPPCDHITFDENARAAEDFHAIVIGFGQVGQAVLKALAMNGQFAGSEFRAAVFAPDYLQTLGQLRYECENLFTHYNIEFFDQDARSVTMFDYLKQNAASIRYVAVCAGTDAANEEIAGQLEHFFAREGCKAKVYLCTKRGICHHENREESRIHQIYTPRVLSGDAIDRAAMQLNHTYCHNDKTPQENWLACDYFSRMSSRASADFAPAFLRAANCTLENWNPTGEVLENLSITEHERWCAFHYCMGFSPMTQETFRDRCQIYLAQKALGEKPIRIAKDLDARIHACLVDWDQLDTLSDHENQITGGQVDYKQMDRDNVLTLPLVLQAEQE